MVKCSQINLTPPISLVNMLYWLSVALINLTLPFLACLFLSFNSFIKAPTSHIRSILLRLLDVPVGSGQSYTATQSNGLNALTSHIRSVLLRLLDMSGGSGQSYTVTQSNLGLGIFIF